MQIIPTLKLNSSLHRVAQKIRRTEEHVHRFSDEKKIAYREQGKMRRGIRYFDIKMLLLQAINKG